MFFHIYEVFLIKEVFLLVFFFFFDSSVKHSLLHFGTFPVSGINKKIYVLNLVEQFKSFKQFSIYFDPLK